MKSWKKGDLLKVMTDKTPPNFNAGCNAFKFHPVASECVVDGTWVKHGTVVLYLGPSKTEYHVNVLVNEQVWAMDIEELKKVNKNENIKR